MALNNVPGDLIDAAARPRVSYGHGILGNALTGLGRYAVMTMAEPWALAQAELSKAVATHFVTSMDRAEVERAEASLPQVDAVIGLGGGSSVDMAKYVAWRRGIKLVTAPTIVSVDAAVTNTIAVRENNKVRYIGFVVPDAVIVDYSLIAQAPQGLNRAGIGDILSIHTGCWDWQITPGRAGRTYHAPTAAQALALRDRLEEHTAEISAVTEKALRFITEAYIAENALCLHAGTSQPEEGSEHYWAYNLEYRTVRHFVHGELICLGVLLMSRLQDNEPERIKSLIEATGVRYHPRDLGITRDELHQSLTTLRNYVEAEGLPRSIIDERAIDDATVERLIAGLRF